MLKQDLEVNTTGEAIDDGQFAGVEGECDGDVTPTGTGEILRHTYR